MGTRVRQWQPQIVRDRIRVGGIVRRLYQHVAGEIEMSPTQVRAAEILLKKTLPDLTSVEHSGSISNREMHDFTRDELIAIAGGEGVAAEDGRAGEPAAIHRVQ